MASVRDEIWLKDKKKFREVDLLIIDDFLLEPLDAKHSRELLEIIEAKHKRSSVIICSQISKAGWHKNLKPAPIVDAILDRVAYSSHTIHIEGKESMRKRLSSLKD